MPSFFINVSLYCLWCSYLLGYKAGKMSESFVALAKRTIQIDETRMAHAPYELLIYQKSVTCMCQVIIQHAEH